VKIKAKIFREYDIRGVTKRDLTEEIVEHLGKSIAVYMRGKKKHNCMAVGRDGRLTSKAYAHALIDGLTASGIDVIDLGEVPTGVTYFSLFSQKVDGAVMITGSHNPKEYNGLKIAVNQSTIHGSEIQKIRAIAEAGKFLTAKKPVTITRMNTVPKYLNRITRDIKLKRKLTVVVDAGNGVGGKTAIPLFEALGCEVIPLYCEVDGNFPNHHPDPTLPESLKSLVAAVKRRKADLGIAFDGDADRIGAVDNKGEMIAGDRLLIIFARAILKEKPGAAIIGEVKCSRSLYEDIAKHGGKPIMWMAGHSLIKAAMKKYKAELAGEMSGHIFFKHRWYGFDDAVYAGARLLEILASGSKSLHEHLDDIPKTFVTDEIRIETTDDSKFRIVAAATRYFKEDLGLDVNDIDGARIEFDDGWGLVRASNTSPMLVMRAEATTRKRLKEICTLIEGKIDELNS
jgi:phosphomannomutase/phosphoglucomutase